MAAVVDDASHGGWTPPLLAELRLCRNSR